ncbi:MAG: hypothetical protein AB7F74_05055 [Parvibaculaceae bacterium]
MFFTTHGRAHKQANMAIFNLTAGRRNVCVCTSLVKAGTWGLVLVGASITGGIPSFGKGPSFDCQLAKSPDEIAICSNSVLSEMDLLVSEGYEFAKLKLGAAEAIKIALPISVQRYACRSDMRCILKTQAEAIQAYQMIGAPLALPKRRTTLPAAGGEKHSGFVRIDDDLQTLRTPLGLDEPIGPRRIELPPNPMGSSWLAIFVVAVVAAASWIALTFRRRQHQNVENANSSIAGNVPKEPDEQPLQVPTASMGRLNVGSPFRDAEAAISQQPNIGCVGRLKEMKFIRKHLREIGEALQAFNARPPKWAYWVLAIVIWIAIQAAVKIL